MTSNPDSQELKKYETSVMRRDGSLQRLRPIRPDDEKKWLDLVHRLSPHTIYLRFHYEMKNIPQEDIERFCSVDYDDTFALIAVVGEGDDEQIIGISRYARFTNKDSAEVALTVEDPYQGQGIGTHLLIELGRIAREKGIRNLVAYVLAVNANAREVFKRSGFPVTEKYDNDVYTLILDIREPPQLS